MASKILPKALQKTVGDYFSSCHDASSSSSYQNKLAVVIYCFAQLQSKFPGPVLPKASLELFGSPKLASEEVVKGAC